MNLLHRIRAFRDTESGAVTVDWVVITAAVVGIALAVLMTLGTATHDYAEAIDSAMDSRGIATY